MPRGAAVDLLECPWQQVAMLAGFEQTAREPQCQLLPTVAQTLHREGFEGGLVVDVLPAKYYSQATFLDPLQSDVLLLGESGMPNHCGVFQDRLYVPDVQRTHGPLGEFEWLCSE